MTLIDINMMDTGLHEIILVLGAVAFIVTIMATVFWMTGIEDKPNVLLLLLIFLNIALFTTYNSIDKYEIHTYFVEDYDMLDDMLEQHKIYNQPEKHYYNIIKERE